MPHGCVANPDPTCRRQRLVTEYVISFDKPTSTVVGPNNAATLLMCCHQRPDTGDVISFGKRGRNSGQSEIPADQKYIQAIVHPRK